MRLLGYRIRVGQQVGKQEAIPLNGFACHDANGRAEDRSIVDEGVKLAVFRTGIDRRWHFGEQAPIIFATRPLGRNGAGIDAAKARPDSGSNDLVCQFPGRSSPNRE